MIALKLKEVFGLEDINDLPIIYNISWYEQKAVIVLLALLSLGVKNIHLGPTLPAFLSPAVAKVLVENFGIAGIQSVEEDINLFSERLKASPLFYELSDCSGAYSSSIRITLAGTPAATAFGGTSFVTTAPAPMIAPSPMVTPRHDGDPGSQPYIFPDDHRAGCILLRVSHGKVMVQRGDDGGMADEASIPDGDPALVLKLTAGIDKYVFSHRNVFSAVCIKGRKQAEALIHRLADQL